MSCLDQIHAFWKKFEEKEELIKTTLLEKDFQVLDPIIVDLDDYVYQISGCHFFVETTVDDFEMTFDTGPNKTSQLIAQNIKDCAPQSIRKHWIINDCLPPLSQKAIQAEVQIKDQLYYLNDFFVFYEVDSKNQMIQCKLYNPSYHLIDNTERKKEMSMYLIELSIGQCAYEAYISNIDYLDSPDNTLQFCNLMDFYEDIMKQVDHYNWKEYASPLDIFSVYQPIQDFAHDSLRKDMKYIFTKHPLLIEDSLEEKQDTMSDFRAKGGEFGYLYYSNMFQSQQDASFRQELSKKLEEEFKPTHVAHVIGGAIGKSYSYIDWVVYDKDQFEKLLKETKKNFKEVDIFYRAF